MSSKNIVLRLEPMYLQKGAEHMVFQEDIAVPPEGIVLPDFAIPVFKGTVSYLEVPVFFKLAFVG